jgi:hypothetical protein
MPAFKEGCLLFVQNIQVVVVEVRQNNIDSSLQQLQARLSGSFVPGKWPLIVSCAPLTASFDLIFLLDGQPVVASVSPSAITNKGGDPIRISVINNNGQLFKTFTVLTTVDGSIVHSDLVFVNDDECIVHFQSSKNFKVGSNIVEISLNENANPVICTLLVLQQQPEIVPNIVPVSSMISAVITIYEPKKITTFQGVSVQFEDHVVVPKTLHYSTSTTSISCDIPTFVSSGILPRTSTLRFIFLDSNGDPVSFEFAITLIPEPNVASVSPLLRFPNIPTKFVVLIDQMPIKVAPILMSNHGITALDTFSIVNRHRIKISFTLPPCSTDEFIKVVDNLESPVFVVQILIACDGVRSQLSLSNVDFGVQVASLTLKPWQGDIPPSSQVQVFISDHATNVLSLTLVDRILYISSSIPSHVQSSFTAVVAIITSVYSVDFVDDRNVLSEVQVEVTPEFVSWRGGTIKIILMGTILPQLRLAEQNLIVAFGNSACELRANDAIILNDFFAAFVVIQELALSDRNGAFLSLSTDYGLQIARVRVNVEPQLSVRCVLSNTASGLNLLFSTTVDKSEISLVQRSCSLYFKGSSLLRLGKFSSCIWTSASDLLVSFGIDPLVQAGDFLLLSPDNPIRSSSGLTEISNLTLWVEESEFPQALSVKIHGDGTIGTCSDAVYTVFTFPDKSVLPFSLSYSWKSSDSVLNSCLRGMNRPSISISMLCLKSLGTFIQLSVTILTPSGSTFSDEIQLFLSTKDVPSIDIVSPTKWFVMSDPNIMFSAKFSFCSCCNLSDVARFQWTVFDALNGQRVVGELFSQTGSVFAIPPKSLLPNMYKLQLIASTSATSAVASVMFRIERSPLVAQIEGGNRNVLPTAVTLDGSLSHDPDQLSTLAFTWTCFDVKNLPCLSSGGSTVFFPETSKISLNESMPFGIYTFLLQVRSSDGRTTFAQVQLNISDESKPIGIISVSLSTSGGRNPFSLHLGRPFALFAKDMISGEPAYAHWTASDNLNVDDIEICPLGALGSSLVFSGQKLLGILKFRAKAKTVSAMATIDVLVNVPPQGGLCSVLPSMGNEATVFTSACTGMTDEDLPISFSIRYFNTATQETMKLASTIVATRKFLMPSGSFLVHVISCDAFQSCSDSFSTSLIVSSSSDATAIQLNMLRDSYVRGQYVQLIDTAKLISKAISSEPKNRRLQQEQRGSRSETLLTVLNTVLSINMNSGLALDFVLALQAFPMNPSTLNEINSDLALKALKKLCLNSQGYLTFSVIVPYLQLIFGRADPLIIPEILSTVSFCNRQGASDILVGQTPRLNADTNAAWVVKALPIHGIDVYNTEFSFVTESLKSPKVFISRAIENQIRPADTVSLRNLSGCLFFI